MASSGNFSTWNPLVKGTENVSSGNCKLDMTTGNRGALGNFEIPLTGKWYFEGYIKMASNLEGVIGVSDAEVDLQSSRGGKNDSNTEALNFSQYTGSSYFAIKIDSGSEDAGGRINLGSNDNAVIGVAVNRDDNELKLYANNTLRFTLTLSATTKYFPWCGVGGGNNSSAFVYLNAGQDSTFGGNKTAGGNADGNGFGDFAYSPPTGFLALCSANLPISDDIDPAQTDDDFPQKQFNAVLYTGNGSTNAITGLGLKPDLVWAKSRSASQSHRLYDSSRGGSSMLFSDTNSAAQTGSTFMTSFDSDGFTYSSSGSNANDSSVTYVAWCWRANGGVTSSNTDGDITTTVQANQKAGFSIFTYTGNGGGAGTSMGHGLSQAPDIWFLKQRSNNGESSQKNWRVMLNTGAGGAFRSLSGSSQTLVLNETSAAGGLYRNEGNFEPTSTVVQAPNNGNANSFFVVSGNTYVSYCWHSVEGYSKFGSYVGNGDADGPFIYTGFRPKMFFIKNIGATSNWHVYDTERSTFNVMNDTLNWNDTSAEQTDYAYQGFDVLSNGIKTRGSNGLANSSGVTYIYGAWGDVPFKYNNTF